jgi:hypothetical protein
MVPKNCWPALTSSPEVKAGRCCSDGGAAWADAGHGHVDQSRHFWGGAHLILHDAIDGQTLVAKPD